MKQEIFKEEDYRQDIEAKEDKNPEKKPEVWMVEDDDLHFDNTNDNLMDAKKKNEIKFTFEGFDQAKKALEKLKNRLEKENEAVLLPAIIIVDGKLKSDEEELRSGAKFIEAMQTKLKEAITQGKIKQEDIPIIVAFSNDNDENEAMKKIGADCAFDKVKEPDKLINLIIDDIKTRQAKKTEGK